MTTDLSFDIAGTRTQILFTEEPRCEDAKLAVFDTNTFALFGASASRDGSVVVAAGEPAKEWKSVQAVLERCAERALGRDDVVAGVGGGVVCDITALAASLYMRGCGLALVPTTLLAMVDASFGGKTGVDFMGFKNLVGTFYPAGRIFIAPGTVRTLPPAEYLSGLAEVIKTAIIGDAELFAFLARERAAVMAREPAAVQEMIWRSLAVKGRIVQADPREQGARALLNLGHTFGHALESASGFTGWTHGEAVAWGMGRALALGVRLGMTDRGFAEEARRLLAEYGYRLRAPIGYQALAPALGRDKKKRHGRVRLVIPCGLCDVRIREAEPEEISMALEEPAGGAQGQGAS